MPTLTPSDIHTNLPHLAAFHPLTYSLGISGWSSAYLALNHRIEVQLHDGSGTEYATFFVRTESDGTILPFRIDSFLTSQFELLNLPDLSTSGAQLYPGYYVPFEIKFRELYTGTTGSWVEDTNTYYAYAAAQERGNTNGAELVDYTVTDAVGTKKFLTPFEIPRQVVNSPFGLSVVWNGANGTSITMRQQEGDPDNGIGVTNDTAITLNKGMNYIEVPNYGVANTNYFVWLESSGSVITEFKQVQQKTACSQESTTVAWINRFGALDFWTFCCKRFEQVDVEAGQVFQGDFTSLDAGAFTDEVMIEKAERIKLTVGEKITNADHAQGISQVFSSVLVGEVNSSEEFLPRLVSGNSWMYRTGNNIGNNFEITLVEPEKYKPHH